MSLVVLCDRLALGWALFAWPADRPVSRCFAIGLVPESRIERTLGGLVSTPGTVDDDDDREPVPGGLFDDATFGPMDRGDDGTPSLPDTRALHPYDRRQSHRYGAVLFCEPVVDPSVQRYAPERAPT